MSRFLQPLLLLLGRSDEHYLRRQIQFLKAENEILRAPLPKRIVTTPEERRRLLKFGQPLGSSIRELRSRRRSPRGFGRKPKPEEAKNKKPGRPRTAFDLRELVLKIARETGFGYTRILGELRKLGVTNVCRQTLVNILKENGFDAAPVRGEST